MEEKKELRTYEKDTPQYHLYRDMHIYQNYDFVKNMREIYGKCDKKKMTIIFFGNLRAKKIVFSQFSVVFGGATQFLTSESPSLSNFLPERRIHSSVRPLEHPVGQSKVRKVGWPEISVVDSRVDYLLDDRLSDDRLDLSSDNLSSNK